jgi:hypothetical protein
VRTLKTFVLYLLLGPFFVMGQTALTDSDGAALITRVKQTPASQLDSKLPNVKFEEWLLGQVGTDARVAWVLKTGEEGYGFPWVETDISVEGRPGIVILIACGKTDGEHGSAPMFKSLQLVRKGEFAEWPHLHDLRAAMKRARGHG